MKIFIDTNIFFNNWLLKGTHFQLLSKYVRDTNSELIISEVVIEETENKYKVELEKIKKEINDLLGKIRQLTESSFTIDIANVSTDTYNFSSLLRNYFPNFIEIPYENLDNKKLVHKAIHSKKPFKGTEKGYRDAVIWHSLIKYISDNSLTDEIILITNNHTDFLNIKEKNTELHEDLQADIIELGLNNNFKFYTSLKSFIEENISEEEHTVKEETVNEELYEFIREDILTLQEQFNEILETQFEDFAISYLNSLNINEIKKVFSDSGFKTDYLHLMKSSNFEVWEGMEDSSISKCYKLDIDRVAFEYSFNLRICILNFSMNDVVLGF